MARVFHGMVSERPLLRCAVKTAVDRKYRNEDLGLTEFWGRVRVEAEDWLCDHPEVCWTAVVMDGSGVVSAVSVYGNYAERETGNNAMLVWLGGKEPVESSVSVHASMEYRRLQVAFLRLVLHEIQVVVADNLPFLSEQDGCEFIEPCVVPAVKGVGRSEANRCLLEVEERDAAGSENLEGQEA